ncbi:MAG: cell envelope integrity protein CreD [Pseudomonadota bacterium]
MNALANMRKQTATTLKLLAVAILTLVMLIPLAMVRGLIDERQGRRAEALAEIARRWGGEQTLSGPMIVVTERQSRRTATGETQIVYEQIIELPAELKIEVKTRSEVRYLGIYEMPVYTATITMTGSIGGEELPTRGELTAAHLLVPISDTRAIRSVSALTVGTDRYKLRSGGSVYGAIQGVAAPLPLENLGISKTFRLEVTVAGSEALYFLPLGEATSVTMQSKWPSPGFEGLYVPLERDISQAGFSARWQIAELNRSYGQSWRGEPPFELMASRFGVRFVLPGNSYQRSERAIKYGVLFIGLTFLGFFVFETLMKVRLHPVQYLFVGLALTTFYLLLLALSEHIRFGWAYLTAASALVMMVSTYCQAVLASRRRGLLAGILHSAVYAVLFWLIIDESYSLLIGSSTILLLLGIVMYTTRNVDWYGFDPDPPSPDPHPSSIQRAN